MRTSLITSLLAFSLAAACGGGGGSKTPQEVGDKVLAALVAKDWNALKGMHWPVEDAMATCTEIPEEKKGKLKEEVAEELKDSEENFAKCLKTDWTGAKLTGVSGGDVDDPLKGCGDKAHEVKDIKLAIEVGEKKMEVRVSDPVKVGDAFFLFEGIRCKAPELSCADIYDHMTKIVAGAPGAKDRDKEMFSGSAEKKTEFAKECEEMKGEPRMKEILDCVAAAADYAGIGACEEQAKARMKAEYEDKAAVPTPTEPPAPAPADPGVAAPAPAPAPAAGGVAICDKYIKNMNTCTESLPEAAKDAVKKSIDDFKKLLEGQPAEAMTAGCTAAYDAAKKSLGSMCPGVTWD